MKPETNDRQRIAGAFRDLRKKGWFARCNFWCCQTCGCAAVPDEAKNKFIFYHHQDAEAFNHDGNIGSHERGSWRGRTELYITHGEGGDAREVVEALRAHNLDASWDGDMGKRILVLHKEGV